MKVLITGAAGFIGSHLADRLYADGHQVLGVDNFETGKRSNWPEDHADDLRTLDIVHRQGFYALANTFTPDVVIHCAASYKDPNKWHQDTDTNVAGTINAALVAKHHGAKLIYFQTALCYGNSPESPVKIGAPYAPESSYAISKTAGEQYIALSGVPFLSFRLANIYGPRNLSGPIPTFFKRISAGERCVVTDSRRDFVFIDDLVKLVVRAMRTDETGFFHASTGRDYAISTLFSEVGACLRGGECELRPRAEDDSATILLDPSETAFTFGWRALTPLSVGIHKAVEWYRENGVGETYTHLSLKG